MVSLANSCIIFCSLPNEKCLDFINIWNILEVLANIAMLSLTQIQPPFFCLHLTLITANYSHYKSELLELPVCSVLMVAQTIQDLKARLKHSMI